MATVARDGLVLLSNAGAGNGAAVDWLGGPGTIYFEGTIGGATVKIQAMSPRDTWLDVATLAAVGVSSIDLPKGDIRATVTGGTPSGIYIYARAGGQRKGE